MPLDEPPTVTVTDWLVVLEPVQLSVNVLVLARPGVCSLPDVGLAPLHAPLALQLLASVTDQLSVLRPPLATLAGSAHSVMAGGGAEPPICVSQRFATPYAGSPPKNVFVHWPVPATER
jgi:hypothetical protein